MVDTNRSAGSPIRTGRPVPRAWVLGLVVVTMCLRLPFMKADLTDHDTWRQADTASIARNFLEENNILWPRINWAAPGPGYVETEFQLYPYTVSLIYRVLGENPLYGRLLSILVTAFTCLAFHRIACRFLDPWPALLALAFFAMSPFVFRYSRVFVPDPTMFCFYVLALERFLAYLDDERWSSILQAAGAMALAILVKPTSIHLGLVLIVLTVARYGWGALFRPQVVAFGLISLLPSVAYYVHAARIHWTYGNTFGVISGGDSKFGNFSYWLNPRFVPTLLKIDVLWGAGPAGWALAVVGLLGYRREGWRLLGGAWVGTLFLYYLIIGRYSGDDLLGLAYHMFAAAPIALMAGGGLVVVAERFPRLGTRGLAVLVALVLGYEGLIAGFIVTKKPHTVFKAAGTKLAEYSQPEDVVLVLSEDLAEVGGAPNNFEQPDVFFHAHRRGRLLPRDRQNHAGLEHALTYGPKWYVNFDAFNDRADPSFRAEVERRMTKVSTGDGFEIYAINPPH